MKKYLLYNFIFLLLMFIGVGNIVALEDERFNVTNYTSEMQGGTENSESLSKMQIIIKKIDEKGNYLSGVGIRVEREDGSYRETFKTKGEELVISNLEPGKYIISETEALNGYVLFTEKKEVVLSKNKITATVEIENKLTKVEISNINKKDNKLLAGAKLTIQDKEGNVIKDSEGKEYTWITTEEAFLVEGLNIGTYYLVQTEVPEGYTLNEKKVEFKVDGKKELVKVNMKNESEEVVDVPDTLDSRSTLLVAFAMFDIALGIGIVTYVKKNKA